MTTLPFADWLIERYGSAWVVAPRLTRDHAGKGYTLAIRPADYAVLEVEWEWSFYVAPLRSLRDASADLLTWVRMMVQAFEGPADIDSGARTRMATRGLEPCPIALRSGTAPSPCFSALSCAEPASTSVESALAIIAKAEGR